MQVHKVCSIDLQKCPDCDPELTDFVDIVWPMFDFASEIKASGYIFNEEDDVFVIKFTCGGICQCICDVWADLVRIVEWEC